MSYALGMRWECVTVDACLSMSGGGCESSVHRGKDGKHTVQDVPQDVLQDDGKRQCLRASKYALIKKMTERNQ